MPHNSPPEGKPLCYVLQNTNTTLYYNGKDFTERDLNRASPIMDFDPTCLTSLWENCVAVPVFNQDQDPTNPLRR